MQHKRPVKRSVGQKNEGGKDSESPLLKKIKKEKEEESRRNINNNNSALSKKIKKEEDPAIEKKKKDKMPPLEKEGKREETGQQSLALAKLNGDAGTGIDASKMNAAIRLSTLGMVLLTRKETRKIEQEIRDSSKIG